MICLACFIQYRERVSLLHICVTWESSDKCSSRYIPSNLQDLQSGKGWLSWNRWSTVIGALSSGRPGSFSLYKISDRLSSFFPFILKTIYFVLFILTASLLTLNQTAILLISVLNYTNPTSSIRYLAYFFTLSSLRILVRLPVADKCLIEIFQRYHLNFSDGIKVLFQNLFSLLGIILEILKLIKIWFKGFWPEFHQSYW